MLKKVSLYLSIILTLIILIVGLAFISSIFFPFEIVKPKIDSLAFDKSFDFFTPEFYIISKYIGMGIILIGVLLCIFIKNIGLFFYNLLKCLASFTKDLIKKFLIFIQDKDKLHLITFFIILLFSFIIRLLFINQPIRYDEAYTFVHFVKNPLWMTVADFRSTNNHILHSILVKISVKFFGDSLWAIRLPAFIFGILIVPMAYTIARAFFNKKTAIITMSILSASSILIEFSTNARGYTIVIFIFLVILGLARYIKNNNNIFACVLFSFISSLGFFTMPLMLYPFIVVIVWLFLSILKNDSPINKRTNLKNLIISIFLTIIFTIILYSRAIFKFGINSAISSNISSGSRPWSYFFTDQWNFIKAIWLEWNRDIPLVLQIFLAICFVLALIFHRKISKYKINLFIPVIICFIPIVLIQKNSIVFPRHWLFLLLLYVMTAAAGFVLIIELIQNKIRFKKPLIIPIISLILSIGLCLSVFFSQSVLKSDDTGTFREAENITIYINKNLQKDDIVLAPSYITKPILTYYFNRYKTQGLCFKFKDIEPVLNKINNIYIIITKDQNLNDMIDFKVLQEHKYNYPKLLETYDSSYIYELQKLK